MTETISAPKAPHNRSNEELQMRELIVPRLRARWPDARIVHELPLRYSSNRIDLAAITQRSIVGVEIKSSRDTTERLEAQLRAFAPICAAVIIALAPKWNEQLPALQKKCRGGVSYLPQRTEAQEIVHSVREPHLRIWTVDAGAGTLDDSQHWTDRNDNHHPWSHRMLDMLHVAELVAIAGRHRIACGKRTTHRDLVYACASLLTGEEVVRNVCRELRERDAFAQGSDVPIKVAA